MTHCAFQWNDLNDIEWNDLTQIEINNCIESVTSGWSGNSHTLTTILTKPITERFNWQIELEITGEQDKETLRFIIDGVITAKETTIKSHITAKLSETESVNANIPMAIKSKEIERLLFNLVQDIRVSESINYIFEGNLTEFETLHFGMRRDQISTEDLILINFLFDD